MLRSPSPIPGRNNILENLWRSITNYVRTAIQGQQRPRSQQWGWSNSEVATARYYDQEIIEPLVRNATPQTRELICMVERCTEVMTAISIRNAAIWGSQEGDDIGWDIGMTLNDEVTPIDAEIYGILAGLRDRVIGGITLKPASERFLKFGDSFLSVGIDFKARQINRILFLPTYECFRLETRQGELLGFEQRRTLWDGDSIQFHPLTCIHFRRNPKFLYGTPLFEGEVIQDWRYLQQAKEDLAEAVRGVGYNPRLHYMPCDYGELERDAYKAMYERSRRDRPILDFYLMNGGDVKLLNTTSPDFTGIINYINMLRLHIAVKSEVPLYLLGIPWDGAKDIATQPAMAFSRSINTDRMHLTQGIKHLCNLELALHDIPKERWNYRIIYPKIYVSQLQYQNPQEPQPIGIEELDAALISSNTTPRSPKVDDINMLDSMSSNQIREGLSAIAETNGHCLINS